MFLNLCRGVLCVLLGVLQLLIVCKIRAELLRTESVFRLMYGGIDEKHVERKGDGGKTQAAF